MVDFLFFFLNFRGSGGVQENSALFFKTAFLKDFFCDYIFYNKFEFRIFNLQIPEKFEYIARMELSELTCLLFLALRNEVRIISRLHLTRR